MDASTSAPTRRFRRVWLPLLVLVLGMVASLGVWNWPSQDWDGGQRTMLAYSLGMGTATLLALWLLFLSGLPWQVRVGVLALGGGRHDWLGAPGHLQR